MPLKSNTTTLPIGLDVGESGIRLVQLQDGPQGISVHRCAVWQSAVDDDQNPDPAARADRVCGFVKHAEFVGRLAVAGLSPPAVELHPLDLPLPKNRLVNANLNKAAAWEISRLTTIDQERLQSAVWVLPESKRSKATLMGVAAPRDDVLGRVELCRAARLECTKVDAAPCALARLAWRLRRRPANQVWGVLDLGYHFTRLMICVDDYPVMVRSFEIGGRGWTEKIAAGLKLSLEAAERNKMDLGLTHGAASDAPKEMQELSTLILGILRGDLQRLALETERSYEYILQCYAPRKPGALVMVGGGARFRGLDEYLAGQLGIDVVPISRCHPETTAALSDGLSPSGNLEMCALACALSLQGRSDHA